MKTASIVDHIVSWLKEYTEKSGTNGYVVGVSGGIDSAVTSALLARTGLPLTCLEMPIHQKEDQVNRAQEHLHQLRVNYPHTKTVQVDLTSLYRQFQSTLPTAFASPNREMALINSRARLRMTTLYYFAALEGKLVAGTGNKVEDFGVGFYTKYGDGGVDLSPIADLLKTEVFALGTFLKVPQSILQAPPTDGLWGDDRSDEDQIGASYPELEWAMAQSEAGKRPTDFNGRKREVIQIYQDLHRANRHKMEPIPVCEIPTALKD